MKLMIRSFAIATSGVNEYKVQRPMSNSTLNIMMLRMFDKSAPMGSIGHIELDSSVFKILAAASKETQTNMIDQFEVYPLSKRHDIQNN